VTIPIESLPMAKGEKRGQYRSGTQHNRENWVISGGPHGDFSSAVLYSIIETAKLCGLEPNYYIRYILTKLPTTGPDTVASLLPWNVDTSSLGDLTA
jgi:hypothetical protein